MSIGTEEKTMAARVIERRARIDQEQRDAIEATPDARASVSSVLDRTRAQNDDVAKALNKIKWITAPRTSNYSKSDYFRINRADVRLPSEFFEGKFPTHFIMVGQTGDPNILAVKGVNSAPKDVTQETLHKRHGKLANYGGKALMSALRELGWESGSYDIKTIHPNMFIVRRDPKGK